MRLIWKGRCEEIEQLGKSDLPPGAVPFAEPKTPLELNRAAAVFMIPTLALAALAALVKALCFPPLVLLGKGTSWGALLSLLTILPHELLHAVCFPKDAEAQIWYSLKNLIAFVYSPSPVTKARFVFLSLLPSLVFGLAPLVLWIFIPSAFLGTLTLSFAVCCLLFGIGDYLNVCNALVQMPKKAMTQMSGFHSYWFYQK